MSIPGAANPLLLATAAAGGYQISRSLRFNSSDSAYCSRVFSNASASTWTLSAWVKRSALGTAQKVFGDATDGSTGDSGLWFGSDDTLYLSDGQVAPYKTAAVYRDCSAWYHIVASVSSGTTLKIYVNGVDQTASGTPNITRVNSNRTHAIGYNKPSATNYFSGYLADVFFIDGQALDPSAFVAVSATTGQLVPKAYTGSFGTNGFWLKFSDNSAATATTLGKDYSGNSNNWTPNNLSVTAGAGNDSLVDTPTSVSATDTGIGGEIRGNYCTWNPLDTVGKTLSNGNLDGTNNSSGISKGTIAVSSGKWYWEVTVTSSSSGYSSIGIAEASAASSSAYLGSSASTWSYYQFNGQIYTNGSGTSYGASYTTGDVIGVALDLDNDRVTFYKNGVSQGIAATNLTGTYVPAWGNDQSGPAISANFGQRSWAYAAPAGFKALCDTNLPAPVVAKPSTVMDVKLYTGNGSTQTISGLGFSPDLVWIKARSLAYNHRLNDSVRGAQKMLLSNTTDAEITSTQNDRFTSFDATGFTLGAADNSNGDGMNQSGVSYAAWAWDAGSSTVTNTQGSITSSCRTNQSSGFSIVGWTGNGAAASIGHGLGVEPHLVIHKFRGGSSNWSVYTKATGAGARLILNSTGSLSSDGSFPTTPTSNLFYISNGANDNGVAMIAYCFAPVAGYSSFGSYVGNGSADGPFVYTGFRPAWVLIKCSTQATYWNLKDNKRYGYNPTDPVLHPNLSDAESATQGIDFCSNGFKVRTSDGGYNTNGATYIYAAFAESPFQYARAR